MSGSSRDWPGLIVLWSLLLAIAIIIVGIAATPEFEEDGWKCLRYSPLDGECVLLERSR